MFCLTAPAVKACRGQASRKVGGLLAPRDHQRGGESVSQRVEEEEEEEG